MGRRSEATRATYACGFNAFARWFDVQSVDLLIAKIKSSELDAYATLDKFVSWLTGSGLAPKTIWINVGAVKSLLEHEDVLLDRGNLRRQGSSEEEANATLMEVDEKMSGITVKLQYMDVFGNNSIFD